MPEEKVSRTKQDWFCTLCYVNGFAWFPPKADVYTGVNLLAASHTRKSPGCIGSVRTLRVRNPNLMPLADWRDKIRNWRNEKAGYEVNHVGK